MKSKKIHYFLFGLIALLAFGVRFYKLGSLPASLNWDEVSHGYNAYSLLKTGKDQWGVSWPIFNFRAYGDYPTTLNLYLTILPVKLLGLSSFAIRLPSALLGFLTVIVSYFLGKVIFKEKKYALLLMLLTSISPWLVLPSRAVFQSTIAQFFLVSGITLFLFSLKKKKPWLFFFSLLFWALSAYGYHNTRMIAPVFFLGAAFFYKKEIFSLGKKGKLLIIASLLVFSLLSVFQLTNLFSPESRARGKWVFLIDQGAINQINEQRRISQLSPFWTRLKHNKVTYFVPKATDNLLSYFNPRYLFFSGGDHYQFSVPDRGVLNIAGLLFFYLGLIFLLKGVFEKKKMFWFLALWGGIGLVPAIITKGGFQVIRAMSILPLPQILIILGLKETCDFLKTRSKARGRLVFSAFVILALASFLIWWHSFSTYYQTYYSWAWQHGYQEAVSFVKENYSDYDQIVFSKKYGEPHEFILFYWPWDPFSYQLDEKKVWDQHVDWYWVDAFDKFQFWNDWEVKEKIGARNKEEKLLLITSPRNWIEGGELLETINFLDNTKAFEIIEYQ